jgi:tetratricopeptide (TPR) repeat protein
MQRKILKKTVIRSGLACLAGALLLSCGGGSGIGPEEIQKREEALKDRLPIDWTQYNAGDVGGAIDFFTATLDEADGLEGVEAVKSEVKSEAQNGIGWSFMSLQNLDAAELAFDIATTLDRRNADAWVGRAGVSLAQGDFADVVQYSIDALEAEPDYDSASRLDSQGRQLGHDDLDDRHVRLMLSEAYFHLGRYSAVDRPDPNNSAAQLRLVNRNYKFSNPGQLLDSLSVASINLQETVSNGL